MKKIAVILMVMFYAQGIWSQPLPVKLNHTIIIDTDCAIDDMRAISFLLARPGDNH